MFKFYLCKKYGSISDPPKWYVTPFASPIPPFIGLGVSADTRDDLRIEDVYLTSKGVVICDLPDDLWHVGPGGDVSEEEWPSQMESDLCGWVKCDVLDNLPPID